jgi:hypothetical protein
MPSRAPTRPGRPRAQFFGTRLAIMWMVGVPSAPGRCRVLYWFFTPSKDAPERLVKQAAEPDWKVRLVPRPHPMPGVAGALEALLLQSVGPSWDVAGRLFQRRYQALVQVTREAAAPKCSERPSVERGDQLWQPTAYESGIRCRAPSENAKRGRQDHHVRSSVFDGDNGFLHRRASAPRPYLAMQVLSMLHPCVW